MDIRINEQQKNMAQTPQDFKVPEFHGQKNQKEHKSNEQETVARKKSTKGESNSLCTNLTLSIRLV